MFMLFVRAARRLSFWSLLAVFFSLGGAAADSSQVSFDDVVTSVVSRASRSVVEVEASRSVADRLFDGTGDEAVHSLVSTGIVWDTSGHVLVAASAIIERERILVRLGDFSSSASPVGIDYQSGLALLVVSRPLGRPVRLSNETGFAGQLIVAVGNAHGVRTSPSLGLCAGMRPDGTLQFTAPVSAGSLGGGLFDLSGGLVGVIVGGVGRGDHAEVGLAVPAANVAAVVEHLLKLGDRPAGYVGVRSADIEIFPGIEITPAGLTAVSGGQAGWVVNRGIVVTEVMPTSPAARAGLRQGDLLYSVDGRSISAAVDLMHFVRQAVPGTRVRFGLIRGDTPHTLQVEIGRMRLTPFEGAFAGPSDGALRGSLEDSLRHQLRLLKKEIQRLESRLHQAGK